MSNKELAKGILENIGGKQNIESYVHCATRLRFTLKDNSKANDQIIEGLNGVVSVVKGGGQYQVVIGPHVSEVYQELVALVPTTDDGKTEKKSILDQIMGFISGSFSPILPVITAGGMIQVILTLLVTFKLVSDTSDFYLVFYNISQAAFYFIPIYLGYSSAKKLGVDPYLGMMLAGALVLPDMTALIAREGGVNLFGLTLQAITYSSSVVPILLGVFLMSYVYKFTAKWVPNSLKFVLTPLITILITAPLTLLFLGPLGYTIGQYLASFLDFLANNLGWASVMVMGFLSPLLVMGGMHYALFPMLVTSMATNGFDFLIVPGMLAANMAQAGAALAVSLKTKDSKMKQVALSSSITALMGVTEPALYGVNMPLKKPLYAALIGGAAGGLVAGIGGLQAYALISSVVALPSYLTSTQNFIVAVLTVVVGFAVSFIITMFMKIDGPVAVEEKVEPTTVYKDLSVKQVKIKTVAEGEIVNLKDVNDQTFSSLALGKGYAVVPSENTIHAPVSGVITALFPTKHAIGITTREGVEVLVHVGIDTVQLKGEGFTTCVEVNQNVTEGQPLVEVDFEAIKAKGYDITTIVVVTNTSSFLDVLTQDHSEYPVVVVL